jgi:elongation of very long chain fatty acids protein 6
MPKLNYSLFLSLSSKMSTIPFSIRVNNYHQVVNQDSSAWSTNWATFPGVPYAFPFEENFRYNAMSAKQWMNDCWHVSAWIALFYIALIFTLKRYMSTREAFILRGPLAVWSTAWAVFSIIGTIRCLPEFIDVIYHKGVTGSFCDASYFTDIRLFMWYLMFVLSKVGELGDTVFIVLRKQQLITLHWIHHALTLIFCWFVFADVPATARWMVNMNFFVHSFMYAYYAARCVKIPLPRGIAICITVMQIVQMIFGFYINIKSFEFKLTGFPCDISMNVAAAGLALYLLFFALFVNFFVRSYLLGNKLGKGKGSNVTSSLTTSVKAIANGKLPQSKKQMNIHHECSSNGSINASANECSNRIGLGNGLGISKFLVCSGGVYNTPFINGNSTANGNATCKSNGTANGTTDNETNGVMNAMTNNKKFN